MGIQWSRPGNNQEDNTDTVNDISLTLSSTVSDSTNAFVPSIQATRAAISRPLQPIPIWSPQMNLMHTAQPSPMSNREERSQNRRRNRSSSLNTETTMEVNDAPDRERQRPRTASYVAAESPTAFNILGNQEPNMNDPGNLNVQQQLLNTLDNDPLLRIIVVDQRSNLQSTPGETPPLRIMILLRSSQFTDMNSESLEHEMSRGTFGNDYRPDSDRRSSSTVVGLIQWIMLLLLHRSIPVLRSTLDEMSYENLLALQEIIGVAPRYTRQELLDQQLHVYKFASDQNVGYMPSCPICLEHFKDDDSLRKLPCCHVYHSECIDPWLTRHCNSCPLCRATAVV